MKSLLLGKLALILAAGLFSSGCKKETEIEGQIFIVTKGRENIELGLVEVAIVDAPSFDAHHKAVLSELSEEYSLAIKEYRPLEVDLDDLGRKEWDTYEKAGDLEEPFDEAINLLESTARIDDETRSIINLGSASEKNYGWTAELESGGRYDQDKYQEAVAKFEATRTPFLTATSEFLSVTKGYETKLDEIGTTVPNLPFSEKALIRLLETLPAHTKVKTDSEGRFSVILESNTQHVFVAQAERDTGGETEVYYWTVHFDSGENKATKLFLSNDNMSDIPDQFASEMPAIKVPDKLRLRPFFRERLLEKYEKWNSNWSIEPPIEHRSKSKAAGPDELLMISRNVQHYNFRCGVYVSTEGKETAYVYRKPSAAWPKKEDFKLHKGETTPDGQLRFDSFKDDVLGDEALHFTHIPTGRKFTANGDYTFEIPFAELVSLRKSNEPFYVREGQSFTLKISPDITYHLSSVDDNSCIILLKSEGEPDKRLTVEMP